MATGLGKRHMGTDSFHTQALTSLVPRPSPAPGRWEWDLAGLEGDRGFTQIQSRKSLVEDISCLARRVWCKCVLLVHNGLWITPVVYCPTYCAGCTATECMQYTYTHTLMPKLIKSHSVGIQPPFTLLPDTCTLSAAVPINSGSICDSYIRSWHWKGRCIDSTSHVGFNRAIWEIIALQERQDGGACTTLYHQMQLEMR